MNVFSFSQVKLFEVEIQNFTPTAGINNTIKKSGENAPEDDTKKRNLGRPKLGHREHDEGLFKALKHDPEGKVVQRTQWQEGKWERFQNGKTINLRCETGSNYQI